MDENCILIDWFAATTRIWEPTQLVSYLGLKLSEFQTTYGFYGYKDRLMYDGISIHYNLRSDPDDKKTSVMLEMSGQGCRQFETSAKIDFRQLFCDADNGDFVMKRLDIAYDDIDHNGSGLLDLRRVTRDTLHQQFVSLWKGGQVFDKFKINGNDEPMAHALTVQFGSRESAIMLRIYDKAQERGGFDYHWVRAELVLKEQRAAMFINRYLNGAPIGKIYAGVLKNYVRFVRLDHTRHERCSTSAWWEKFLNSAEKIKLYTPKTTEYNLMRLKHFVCDMAGNSAYTYAAIVGKEKFFEELAEREQKLNDNQRRLIAEHKDGG